MEGKPLFTILHQSHSFTLICKLKITLQDLCGYNCAFSHE